MTDGITRGVLPGFYEQLRDELTFPLAWENWETGEAEEAGGARGSGQDGQDRENSPSPDFAAWRAAARARVGESLLQPHDRPPVPFRPRTVDEHTAGPCIRRTVELALSRYGRVRGSLLLPHGTGPHPGVLLLHDHGSEFRIGREKVVRPWADPVRLARAREWSDTYYGGRFVGDELAARGYAVLAVDTLGWGDRGPLAYEDQQALAANFLQLGSSLAGLAAHEDIRAAAFLASLPQVDAGRVGALGFSMGAYRAWQVSALCDTVRAAVAVCWMTGLRDMLVPGNNTLRGQSAYYMLHPGLHRHLDIPDVASLAAPKPALFHAGGRDALTPAAGVATAYRKLRAVWQSQGAGDRLTTTVWPEHGHVFAPGMQDAAYAWLDIWLGVKA